MLNVTTNIDSLEKLDEYIKKVNLLSKVKDNATFREYIQQKCMETLEKVMNTYLKGGTTNDEYIDLYKSSNHLETNDNGFIIYNDATIDADVSGRQNDISNYPDGKFSIALAFEYGVGIVGIGSYENDYFQPWEYNKQNYTFGWWLPKSAGYGSVTTAGYKGMEIYRHLAIEINANLQKWVKDFIRKYGV